MRELIAGQNTDILPDNYRRLLPFRLHFYTVGKKGYLPISTHVKADS